MNFFKTVFKLFTLLLFLYTISGFFLLPHFLKPLIEQKLSNELNSTINIKSLEINPLKLNILVNGFNFTNKDSGELLSISYIATELNFISLFEKNIHLNYLDINNAKIKIKRFSNKKFNFSKYLNKSVKNKSDKELDWSISIDDFLLSNATIEYQDRFVQPSFHKKIEPINLKMQNVLINSNIKTTFHLSSISPNNEKLAVEGRINLKPKLNANIYVYMKSISLVEYKTYIESILKKFTLLGELSGSASFIISEDSDNAIQVKNINLNNTDLTITDKSREPNVVIPLKDISLNILEKEPNRLFSISLDSNVNNRYPVHLNGTYNVEKKSTLLFTDLTLPLPMLWPYATDFLNAKLTNGTATSKIDLDINKNSIKANGTLTLKDISLEHSILNEKILDVKEVSLKSMNLDFTKNVYTAKELSVNELNLFLNKDESEEFNVDTIFKPKEKSTTSKDKIQIDIKTIKLDKSSLNYNDLFVKPKFSSELNNIKATVNEFSTNPSKASKLELSSNINSSAFIDVTSTFLPFANSSDVRAYIANLDIVSLSGYSSKFLGYALNKGKLNLNLDYTLEKSKLLGNAHMNFDNLEVKELSNIKDIEKPTLSLAVALLKDRGNQININVDIDGDTADPSFSVNGLIIKIIINLITNIVTSPFSIIGAILGDSSDFSFVEFKAGESILNKESNKTITAIETALYTRPSLNVEVKGESSATIDAKALARKHLNELLRNEKYLTLLEKNYNLSFQSITMKNSERSRWLKSAYSYFKADTQNDNAMTEYLLEKLNATDDELHFLAFNRAKTIRNELVKRGKINLSQMYLVGADSNSSKSGVTFELK